VGEAPVSEISRIQELQSEYYLLLHAVQSGVKTLIEHEGLGDTSFAGPKHLRVGIDSSIIQTSALATLMMRKGLITEEEYWETQVEFFRNEVTSYEERLSQLMGGKVSLL
jgi:hypothetical protein